MAHRSIHEVSRTPIETGTMWNERGFAGRPVQQAFWILRAGFTIAPILAGLDKFFHVLVDWDKYIAPSVNSLLGGHGHTFMLAAGVIEIAAGLGVALRPRIFSYVVAAWLVGIIGNLLLIPGYYDVALRDLGLALGALALGRLSKELDAGRGASRAGARTSRLREPAAGLPATTRAARPPIRALTSETRMNRRAADRPPAASLTWKGNGIRPASPLLGA